MGQLCLWCYSIEDTRASELLLSMPTAKRRPTQLSSSASAFSTSTPARPRSQDPSMSFTEESPVPTQVLTQPTVPITPARNPHAPILQVQPEDVLAMEADLEYQEADVLAAARSCFENREFQRASHMLQTCRSSKAMFLKIYSQFIVSFTLPLICFMPIITFSRLARRRLIVTGIN